jgi:hypothetical protein
MKPCFISKSSESILIKLPLGYVYKMIIKHKGILCLDLGPCLIMYMQIFQSRKKYES